MCLEALLNLFEFTGHHHGEAVFEFRQMLLTCDLAFVVSMGDAKALTARTIHEKMSFFLAHMASPRFILFRHFFPITLYDLKTSFFLNTVVKDLSAQKRSSIMDFPFCINNRYTNT